MRREVYHGAYYSLETNCGTEIVPYDVAGRATCNSDLQDYCEGKVLSPSEEVHLEEGWLGRLSAPGYLDCTPWGAYETEREAIEDLQDMYGDEEE
jgi:hypothetical protein